MRAVGWLALSASLALCFGDVDGWSWRETQEAFVDCARGVVGDLPAPTAEKWVLWSSTSATGNALNIYVQAFAYALVTGRQVAVGHGRVPQLMCGPEGVFRCGLPHVSEVAFAGEKSSADGWSAVWDQNSAEQHETPAQWFQYRNSGAAIGRGRLKAGTMLTNTTAKKIVHRCMMRAVRCPTPGTLDPRSQLDAEACFMLRAMQLLLPRGGELRAATAAAAAVTAKTRWLGDVSQLAAILGRRPRARHADDKAPRAATDAASSLDGNIPYDWERPVFFEVPSRDGEDVATRFAGAVHIRALPPALEHDGSSESARIFRTFEEAMTSHTTAQRFWNCSLNAAANRDAPRRNADRNADRNAEHATLFLATDSEGLCRHAHAIATAAGRAIACFDIAPVHITRTTNVAGAVRRHVRRRLQGDPAAIGLHSHQVPLLDWWLLSRSRWMASVSRKIGVCSQGAERAGTHGSWQAGKSFFGWALALAGLTPPPPGEQRFSCDCGVASNTVSVSVHAVGNHTARRA